MAANSRFAVSVHILAGLALQPDDRVSSAELAKSVNTNPVVVRRILSDLQKAGLVRTWTGKSGGAALAKNPKDIDLHSVFKAVGDCSVFAFNPNDPNHHCPLSCKMKSLLDPVFAATSKAVASELKRFTLAKLLQGLKN